MTIPNTTYRILVEKLGDSNPSQFVGNEGELFYDPNSPEIKLSDGTTAGGVLIGGTGGGSGDTGNITFFEERIIGDVTDDFGFGVIQLVPNNGNDFIPYGQYLNVYPTNGNDAPHIHISAGLLSEDAIYYDPGNNYLYGDLFLGTDDNYFQVKGNGELIINSDSYDSQIIFNTGTYDRNRIRIECDANDINLYDEGLDFGENFAIAKPKVDYVDASTGHVKVIYTSKVYEVECGSMKLLIQCQGDSGNNCQLSELLIVRPFGGTTVFVNEIGRVTGIGTTPHVTFSAAYNTDDDVIEVTADASSDPDNDNWSFRIVPIEIQQFQD